MAVAIVAIAREYNYNKSDQGLILAAFFIGYILTPILGGSLADRHGGKMVLAAGTALVEFRNNKCGCSSRCLP